MKRFLLLPVLAAFLLASPTALAATKTVSITNAGFVPNAITIDVGDSITWTNSDTKNHQPVSQNASFAAPILKPGETYTFQFKDDGRFNVTDALVKNQRMTVTVKKAATPVGSPTLTVNKTKVIYGGPVVLTGKVPVAKAGEKVTLRAERADAAPARSRRAPSPRRIATPSGAFTFTHAPTAQTTYTVVWQATPATATTSRRRHGHRRAADRRRRSSRRSAATSRFSTKATSAIPYAGQVGLRPAPQRASASGSRSSGSCSRRARSRPGRPCACRRALDASAS